MSQELLVDILYLAAFFIGALGFALGPFIISHFLAPRSTRNTRQKTTQLIECGVPPIGDAWVRYGMAYYLYALMFLAFTVDIMFLFPVAMIYDYEGSTVGDLRSFIVLLIFLGILALEVIYTWKKGVFNWTHKTHKPR